MKMEKNVWLFTFLLSFTAGCCDATTFVAADQLFSAHVTGNFIVFAYEIIKGSNSGIWVKLSTFPVFITAVITGGWIATSTANKYTLLMVQGVLLLVSGMLAYCITSHVVPGPKWATYSIVMLIVFAMGFQNTFGRIYNKEIYGPTTVMTGNVTQAALDIYNMLRTKLKDAVILLSLKKHLILISGFLTGCLTGAVMAKYVGLSAVAIPGFMLIVSINAGLWSQGKKQLP